MVLSVAIPRSRTGAGRSAVDQHTSGVGAVWQAVLGFLAVVAGVVGTLLGVRVNARSQERQKQSDQEAASAGGAWHAVEASVKTLVDSLQTRVTNLEASDHRKSEQITFLAGEVSRLTVLNERLAADNDALVRENETLQELNRELRAINKNYMQQVQALTEQTADMQVRHEGGCVNFDRRKKPDPGGGAP